jgi:hypothetical protein
MQVSRHIVLLLIPNTPSLPSYASIWMSDNPTAQVSSNAADTTCDLKRLPYRSAMRIHQKNFS